MKRVLKWVGIVILVLLIIMVVYAFIGKKEVLNLTIETIDLDQIPDGTYVGEYDNNRWSNKVEVTVKENKITEINALEVPSGRSELAEDLTKEILIKQSPDVDAVSGATASSNGYLKAVEIALQGGQ